MAQPFPNLIGIRVDKYCYYNFHIFQIVSYLVTWFPYACASIAETAGYRPHSTTSYFLLGIPTMLTKTSVCVNPVIYFWLNPQFQKEFLERCGHSQGRFVSSVSKDSYSEANRRFVDHL